MKLILSLLLWVIAAPGLVMAQQKPASPCILLFEKNSHSLSSASISRLDSLAGSIRDHEQIEITGYADADAHETYNTALSRKRAQVVKNYLAAKGFSNTMLLDWKGEAGPLNTNSNDMEKAQNRRVEILRFDARYNAVFEAFKKQYQVYTIYPARDTVLNCAEGLLLRFGAGILQGAGTGPVTIKVQEFYSKSDFVLAGLTTQGPGNTLLESGGMVNIEAWQAGKQLDVKKGRQLGILFKSRQPADSMQLFNGSESKGSLAWLQAVAGSTTTSQQKHSPTKEMMTVQYSIYDTSYVYSHYWEEGPHKITKNTIKGITTIDTISDESRTQTELMLGSSKLGWINCDRFYNSNAPKVNVAVDFKKTITPFVSLVFKDINSIMPCTEQASNRALFNNIPQGSEITVIGIFKPKYSDRVFFAMQKVTSCAGLQVKLNFKELSAEEVKEQLKQL